MVRIRLKGRLRGPAREAASGLRKAFAPTDKEVLESRRMKLETTRRKAIACRRHADVVAKIQKEQRDIQRSRALLSGQSLDEIKFKERLAKRRQTLRVKEVAKRQKMRRRDFGPFEDPFA